MKYSVTRIFSHAWILLVVAVAPLTASGPVHAEDKAFISPSDAYRKGVAARQSHNAEGALEALEYAARGGVLMAKLELARMFADGDGVAQSHAQAFYYFESVANDFAELDPRRPIAAPVAQAFVAVGRYYRDGIGEIFLAPSPERAAPFFQHAASYFGDAEAQYHLARMYLSGEGVKRNARLAVNWLANAAKKHYAPAQALLGDLLWRGDEAVQRQPAKGLALLALARLNAQSGADQAWIEKLYGEALAEAEPGQRQTATDTAARWRDKTPSMSRTVVSVPDAAVPLAPAATKPRGDEAKPLSGTDVPAASPRQQ